MIQVRLLKPNGETTDFGPAVKTLGEARVLVHLLDFLTLVDQLPKYVDFYTRNTEVHAVDDQTNQIWSYVDQDPSGQEGLWDRQ